MSKVSRLKFQPRTLAAAAMPSPICAQTGAEHCRYSRVLPVGGLLARGAVMPIPGVFDHLATSAFAAVTTLEFPPDEVEFPVLLLFELLLPPHAASPNMA